jgi:hypothetical protein
METIIIQNFYTCYINLSCFTTLPQWNGSSTCVRCHQRTEAQSPDRQANRSQIGCRRNEKRILLMHRTNGERSLRVWWRTEPMAAASGETERQLAHSEENHLLGSDAMQYWRFGGTYRLHLQDRREGRVTINQQTQRSQILTTVPWWSHLLPTFILLFLPHFLPLRFLHLCGLFKR